MNTLKKEAFYVVGISIRTTNENGKAMQDIPALWQRFMKEGVINKLSNRVGDESYAVYTDYEKDHTKPYTMILGYEVENLESIPEGMIGKKIEASSYEKFVAKGDLTKTAVVDEWMKIWNSDINRTYTSDFEVYGSKAQDPTNGEAEIFIAVQ
ncbi:AraC family transcriptional regulator [Tenacibaculum aiptasiae]|uniref:AraC family transcriptional regulator n=1 Tax=Tenacibaculum aiptasiae TaxID=426481 RepID=A0A7J5APX5_9FLAO|nr:GyrI-like domain-containing protein [Tenacibaculum aiptasiae]KAB1159668.1 AraC family transcriptional regulator [Tenacibaculum aiptasiae]